MGKNYSVDRTTGSSLKELEEKYRALILVGSEIIFRVSSDWSTMIEIIGRGIIKDTAQPDSDWRKKYIHPADQAYADKSIREALTAGRGFELELRIQRLDGSAGWMRCRAVPILDENGRAKEWFGSACDISERKGQEEALRESERKYQELIEHAPAGIFEVDIKRKRFLSVNDVVCRYTGYSREELLNMSPFDFLSEESISEIESSIDEWLHGAWPQYNLELRVITKEGREVDVLVNSNLIRDENKQHLVVTAVAYDITERKKMEQKLQFQASILESVNEAIMVLNDNKDIIYWNKVAEKISGWSEEEITGQGPSNDVFDSADIAAREEIARQMREHHHFAGEITVKRKDASVIHIDLHVWGISDGRGGRKYSVASFRDISERVDTQTQLLSSKQKNEILASITSRLLESKNPQAIIEDICNKAMDHLNCDVFFNYLVDKKKRAIHLNAYGGVPQDAAKSVEWLRYGSAVCGCVAQEGKRIIAECITENPDSRTELLAALGIQAYACHPLKTGRRVIGTLAFGTYKRKYFTQDELLFMNTVSDYIAIAMGRLLENRKLKDSERRALRLVLQLGALKDELTDEVDALNTLYNLNSNFIIQDDLNSIYKGILNAAISLTKAAKGALQLFHESESMLEMILGYNFSDGFLKRFKYMDLDTGNCGKACKARKRIFDEDVTVSFAGSPGLKYLLEEGVTGLQSTPLISSSGKLVGVLNTYYADKKEFSERELRMLDLLARLAADTIERNMTEEALKNSERKALALVADLEEVDKNKNRFISILSHELRNPLATIMAGISLLEATGGTKYAIETMRRQSEQLCRLVDDLLDMTRITQNKITLKKRKVNIGNLVYGALADLKPRFDEKNITVGISAEEEPPCIVADPVRLTQALGNLLNNSYKFTEESGSVSVTLYREEDHVLISIKDSGIGIKKEMLSRLFQPFVQADESLDRGSGGLGLGLSITKGIVELHGGSITAYSEGLGRGCEFVMRLPISATEQTDEESDTYACPKKPLKLLVIEDNRDFAEMLCTMLRQTGHEAFLAFSGPEGLGMAKELKPDAVFCDIGLPDMNGYEVARRLRENRYTKHLKLIALTGYAAPQDIDNCRQSGFDLHIAKSASIDALNRVLGQLG